MNVVEFGQRYLFKDLFFELYNDIYSRVDELLSGDKEKINDRFDTLEIIFLDKSLKEVIYVWKNHIVEMSLPDYILIQAKKGEMIDFDKLKKLILNDFILRDGLLHEVVHSWQGLKLKDKQDDYIKQWKEIGCYNEGGTGMSMVDIMYKNNRRAKQTNCKSKMLLINRNLIPMPAHTLLDGINWMLNEEISIYERISYKVFNYILLYLQKDNINELVDKHCICELTDDATYNIFKNMFNNTKPGNDVEKIIYDYLLSVINKDNLFKVAIDYLLTCEFFDDEKVLSEETKTIIEESISKCLKTFVDKE